MVFKFQALQVKSLCQTLIFYSNLKMPRPLSKTANIFIKTILFVIYYPNINSEYSINRFRHYRKNKTKKKQTNVYLNKNLKYTHMKHIFIKIILSRKGLSEYRPNIYRLCKCIVRKVNFHHKWTSIFLYMENC